MILHNNNLIVKTDVIGCPFSDHDIEVAELKMIQKNKELFQVECRSLTEESMQKIVEEIDLTYLKCVFEQQDVNDQWAELRNILLKIIDFHAPKKKRKIKQNNNVPWIDRELIDLKNLRDSYYSLAESTQNVTDWENYKELRKQYQSLNRVKIIEYFNNKNMNDFKNSKKFLEFYSSSVKVKSDKSSCEAMSSIIITVI